MPDEKDTKLATALKQAKQTPMFFAFVAKGTNDGALIVAKKKISAKEVNEAKAESGGKKVFRGRCTGEEGKLVFEMAIEPPGTLAKQLKTVIQDSAGITIAVLTRLAPDLEDEEGEVSDEESGQQSPVLPPPAGSAGAAKAPPPPGPPSASPTAAALKRLNALSGDIKTAMAGPDKARVQLLFGTVNQLIKSNDQTGADQALDELEKLIGTPKDTAPTPPPAQVGPAVIKRLNALSADIKTAMAGPNKARVQQLFVAVNAQVKNNDFEQASQTLDELESALKAPQPTQSGNDTVGQAEWERRVNALEPRVLDAQKKRAGEAKWMMMLMSAQDLGGDGQVAKAITVLDKLEGMLNAPPSGTSNGALDAALAKWTTARGKVIESLNALEGDIRAMNDPDGNAAIVLLKAIQANLTARPDNPKAVAELESYINTDPIITDAEEPNGFGINIVIRKTLLPALAGVRSTLSA